MVECYRAGGGADRNFGTDRALRIDFELSGFNQPVAGAGGLRYRPAALPAGEQTARTARRRDGPLLLTGMGDDFSSRSVRT
jgi:hypothetical protein